MRVIFFGTPKFAKVVLDKICNSKHEVVGVVCQSDKPNQRGNKIEFCDVKKYALEKGLKIFQFDNVNDNASELQTLNADVIVTAAYGQILRENILTLCKYGVVNVHGSLLPKYRGASPIQYAILKGEKVTGVTIMKSDKGMDTGDIMLQKEIEILDEDNSETLFEKMSLLGSDAIVEALDKLETGEITYKKQNSQEATYTKLLKKENAFINYSLSAKRCNNKIRAYFPNPVAKTMINGELFKIFSAKVIQENFEGENGEVLIADAKKGLIIKCAEGALEILELSAPNGKRMTAKAYLNGKKIPVKSICK